MNDYTTMLIATGRMNDRLREAEMTRRAALATRHFGPMRGRVLRRLLAQVRALRGREVAPLGDVTPRPERTKTLTAPSGEVCAC